MNLQTIKEKAIEHIKSHNGTCNFDYWKGYCAAYDDMTGNRHTWDLLIKGRLTYECEKYKNSLVK